ncbi:MAG: Arm DNA-binding domain-containing protein [Bacteroidota bacterium]
MAVEKKITVKLKLNKTIKPQVLDLKLGSMYPIYIEVSYDRNTTRFPTNRWILEELWHGLANDSTVDDSLEVVEKMVANEIERSTDFSITGFGNKFKSYQSSLLYGMRVSLMNSMKKFMGENLNFNSYNRWDALSLKNKTQEFVDLLNQNKGNDTQPVERLIYLTSIAQDCLEGATIYDWLLSDNRSKYVSCIENRANLHDGKNAVAMFNGIVVGYKYKPTPANEVEGLDLYAYALIDAEFSTIPTVERIVYDEKSGVLNVKI